MIGCTAAVAVVWTPVVDHVVSPTWRLRALGEDTAVLPDRHDCELNAVFKMFSHCFPSGIAVAGVVCFLVLDKDSLAVRVRQTGRGGVLFH